MENTVFVSVQLSALSRVGRRLRLLLALETHVFEAPLIMQMRCIASMASWAMT